MARKKRKRKPARSPEQEPYPGWMWMLFGLAIGLSVAFAIYMKEQRGGSSPQSVASEPASLAEPIEPTPQPVAQAPVDPPRVGAGANATARDAAKGKARAAVSAEGPPAFGEDDTDDDAPTGRTPAAAVATSASVTTMAECTSARPSWSASTPTRS